MKNSNDVRRWPSFKVNCKNLKAIIRFYSIIGMKNNQSSVSDADRKPRFRHYSFTLGLGFLCLHQRPMIDSIYLLHKDLLQKKSVSASSFCCENERVKPVVIAINLKNKILANYNNFLKK